MLHQIAFLCHHFFVLNRIIALKFVSDTGLIQIRAYEKYGYSGDVRGLLNHVKVASMFPLNHSRMCEPNSLPLFQGTTVVKDIQCDHSRHVRSCPLSVGYSLQGKETALLLAFSSFAFPAPGRGFSCLQGS